LQERLPSGGRFQFCHAPASSLQALKSPRVPVRAAVMLRVDV